MKEKEFDKKLELREWQKMFNPSKSETSESILLKKRTEESQSKEKNDSAFCW